MADPTPPPDPDAEPEPTDETTAEEETAPLNRAERRARGRTAPQPARTGPAPDPTLRRGRGPRSHTKRV